ncbi:hypothetical protein ACFU93_38050 [Streptomyces sp. NPDC057611]|uniref:hypothetical protein n=1 Tax=Streptomyces sp. NPDC057611 TaxID=3346182 RepID=UPI0036AA948C
MLWTDLRRPSDISPRATLPGMLAAREGAIVTVASLPAFSAENNPHLIPSSTAAPDTTSLSP